MTIFRIKLNQNFTVISNAVVISKDLSLKAKGLYAYMISRPDDWDFSMAGLESCLKEGREAVRGALVELINNGIAKREKIRQEDGTFSWEITVFQDPSISQPSTGQPSTGLPSTVNKQQLNTDNQVMNTNKKTNTKKDFQYQRFKEFWDIFPKQRRGSEDNAIRAYKKAVTIKGATEEEIINGARKYAVSQEVRDLFAKGAASWLNDDRWKVDYSAKPCLGSQNKATGKKPDYMDTIGDGIRFALQSEENNIVHK